MLGLFFANTILMAQLNMRSPKVCNKQSEYLHYHFSLFARRSHFSGIVCSVNETCRFTLGRVSLRGKMALGQAAQCEELRPSLGWMSLGSAIDIRVRRDKIKQSPSYPNTAGCPNRLFDAVIVHPAIWQSRRAHYSGEAGSVPKEDAMACKVSGYMRISPRSLGLQATTRKVPPGPALP